MIDVADAVEGSRSVGGADKLSTRSLALPATRGGHWVALCAADTHKSVARLP